MRVLGQCLTSLLVAASTASVVEGFAPTPSFVVTTRRSIASAGTTTSQSSSSSTVLYISSWGTTKSGDSASSAGSNDVENKNPEENVQAYLKAPDAVEARDNVDGTVLVSGLVRTSDRTDQFIFDLLNHEESAFEFQQIIAYVDDEKFAKKRLLSRSARYGGLLNKLNFIEADSSSPGSGSLPTSQQLEGVKSWVAYLEGDNILTEMEQVATTAKGVVGLENVAILMTNAIELDVDATKAAIEALKDSGVQYTVVAVGKLEDHAEGQIPYKYAELGTTEGVLSSDAIFSRNEALRMVTECLQLECGVNKAWAFSEVYDVNATEAKLIKGLRVAGYARPQEIDFMMRDGPTNYQAAIDEFKEANPDYAKGHLTSDIWWEDEEFQKSVRERSERESAQIQAVKDARTEAVETIAKEWSKREFFRLSMEGSIEDGMSEEEFTKTNWERALFEGDLKYRQIHGEVTEDVADAELLDFKAQQERKKQTMLQRAKEEMKDLLNEDNLGGEDLDEKLDKLEADADNTES